MNRLEVFLQTANPEGKRSGAKLDPINCLWVVREGSIYTAQPEDMRSSFPGNKKTYKVQVAVAFNVGDALAHHIVETHNAHLKWKVLGIRNKDNLSPF
jgi:1,2-phenylacetyl-CoA epoxidase PaaB subunit